MPEICLIQPAGEPLHLSEVKNDRRVDDDADDAKIRSLISAARQAVESKTRQQLLHARWKLVLDTFPMAGWGAMSPFRASVSIPAYAIQLPHSPVVDVISIQYIDMSGELQTMPQSDYVVNSALMPAIITPAFGKVWPIPLPQIGSVIVIYDAGYASPITTAFASEPTQFKVSGPVTWTVGARVNFYNSGGLLPAPLDADTAYLVASAANGAYTLMDIDGNPIALTSDGTGRSFIGVVPDGIRSWMLLRIGSLYENREEVAVGQRIVVLELPFVDGLLDPYIASTY
ncbi:phage head-tail connector protein [Glaciimonas sp. PCH181]|uniref:head-tail connector protein n=1 Tax=Glaciimonas sp. PCH181 TaxID=2133943 RepID=UPI000D39D2F5|nr:phage head-tail connector protein [Glaciimonas sp. PCH181]PUA17268.1 hypothetical protein C7W93_15155 [Glaciimonas sp. PCH181]